jgi:hypothetical protein
LNARIKDIKRHSGFGCSPCFMRAQTCAVATRVRPATRPHSPVQRPLAQAAHCRSPSGVNPSPHLRSHCAAAAPFPPLSCSHRRCAFPSSSSLTPPLRLSRLRRPQLSLHHLSPLILMLSVPPLRLSLLFLAHATATPFSSLSPAARPPLSIAARLDAKFAVVAVSVNPTAPSSCSI